MSEITQLGYLGFEVSDLGAWEQFATNVLGVMVVNRRDDGGFALRNDSYDQRFIVVPGDADDLAFVGLECADAAAISAVVERLKAADVEVHEGDSDAADLRKVEKFFHFLDPAGNRIELYYGPTKTDAPFESKVVATHFIADDLGLGHCVLRCNSLAESRAFYLDVMGFKLSDHIICDLGGYHVNICFTHINPRHHSIALGEKLPKRIHHFLLQVDSLDDVGMGFDRAVDNGVRVSQTIGRHPNDKMVSFYAHTPSGFEFEYGWGAIEVDDSKWSPTTHDRISEWGHRRPPYRRPKG